MKDEDKSATQLLEELKELRQQFNKLRQNDNVQNLSHISYRELFDKMSDGVAVYEAKENGREFTFRDFNKAAEKIEDIKKEDIIGKNVLEVFPGVKEFGLFDVFQRVWRTGNPEHHPISMYEDNRITGWRENYVYKLPNGQIVAVYEDITKRKQAEAALDEYKNSLETIVDDRTANLKETNRKLNQEIEERKKTEMELKKVAINHKKVEAALRENEQRLSKIMETAVDSIVTIDQSGIIESFNTTSENMFGYSAQEVIGKNIRLLMNHNDSKAHDQYLNRYLNTGEARAEK